MKESMLQKNFVVFMPSMKIISLKKISLTLSAIICLLISISAQNRSITGRVTDASGQAVAGASVLVKGTRIGTTTNAEGSFTLNVPANARTLVFSSVNMSPREVAISGSTVDVTLTASATSLEGVVVTALGISRDKRSLGYASQSIQGSEIANKGEVNLVNALQGKVAGVNITNASGSAGASTNINIRGISSFTGSNQPLFVVDGVPISNNVDRTPAGSQGTLGDAQPANRALDIDMNNVESVNILKGPAAAVLYGSRAAAGAIIITTKRGGRAKGGAEVIFNSSYAFQEAFGLPKVQNEYGQGTGGVYNPLSNTSFGPRFGSTPSIENGLIIGGVPVTNYQAYPNNINDFFRQGTIAENNITINGGDGQRNQTFSLGNLTQQGILYNTFLKRTNLKFGANAPIGEKIKLGGSITYTNTVQQGTQGGNSSGLSTVLGLGRSVNLTASRDSGTFKTPDGKNNFFIPNTDNPYFNAFENPSLSNLNRFIGNVNFGYDVLNWLNISYRLGGDIYTDRRKQILSVTSQRAPTGQVLEQMFFRNEINGDLIITANRKGLFNKDLNLTALLGQNINQRNFQLTQVQGDALSLPDFFNVSNATTFSNGSGESNTLRRLLGYYAQASFNYKNYAFVEFTGRVDQSSTLPKNNNSYFYPSVNASLLFTDAFGIKSDIFSYGKIRVAYAKVGRDADPYLLDNLYSVSSFGNNVANFNFPFGTTAGFGASSTIAPDQLSPEFTTSYEGGITLQFFKNRASIDVTYYNQNSKAQIINVTVPASTGFSTLTTNIGELSNKGLEIAASATVIRSRGFTWDVNANYTRQINKVISIADGVDFSQIPGNGFTGSLASFKVGQPYGVIIGNVIPKSPDGERLINPSTGIYQPGVAGQVLANPNPEYQWGLVNNLVYKGFNLGFTFDFTKGGQVLSFTAATYKTRGALDITAVDREQPHILPGVIADPANSGKFIPNNIQISGQAYWQALGGLQSEFNVYDATVLHLRDVTLGYTIPSDVTRRLKIGGIRFGVFARNVFYYAPNSPIDPQLNTQGAGNIRGIDGQGTPNARTIGANLRLTF